jgi:PAS domain S-box-containing protein
MCGTLALALAAMARWPQRFDSSTGIGLAVIGVAAAMNGAALLLGHGVQWVGLSFVPLLLIVAATMVRPAVTLALAAAQALAVAALYAQSLAEQPLAARAPEADMRALVAHAVMLLAAALVGLLMRMVIERSAAAARSREQRFKGLLTVAADWYWEMNAQMRFTHLALDPLSDADSGGVLGRTPWEIDGFGLDADAMDAFRADLEARHAFVDVLLQRTGADGRERWFALSGRPRADKRGVFIGYWGLGRDVTLEQASERERQASDVRYRELFTRSPSPLVLHRDGVVLEANTAALALFGAWAGEDLIGRALLDFYDEADGSRATAARRVARLDEMPVGEAASTHPFTLRTGNGRLLSVQVSSVKVEAAGGAAILSIYRDETERLRAERARERSEALLTHLVATTPELITLTDLATGRYVMVNDSFTAATGWTRDEAVGRTSVELGVWGDAAERERFVQAIREHGELRNHPLAFRDRTGREFATLVSAARFTMESREYLVLNGRDVTESERERLEREAILANASIGIALTRERKFQLANPAFEQMFGWLPGTLAGQGGDVTSVDAEAYAELGRTYGPALARGEAVEFERTMKRHDGSTFLCRVLARPIDPTHPAKGATIWITEDVTEQRAVAQALARARDEAEAANRAKSAFLANTSHEIRTPLNGLVGLARLARQPGLDAARRDEYLHRIDDSAQALSGVISDILDLSKIEAGKLALEHSEFDLWALLESVEHGYSALAEARALTLVVHVDPAVPRRVVGDALRVRQILSNYLGNAIKFTERGSVRLAVTAADGDPIRFEVEDSGPGIAPEVQARLFEPFTQADDSTTRRYGGTGLGLSICRQLAQMMGGTVGLRSALGQGSRFWALLPLPACASSAPRSDFGALADGGGLAPGLSLLVVEDNAVNMMIVSALLQQWGVQIAEATNGVDAVDLVNQRANQGRPFDLVLMDLQMPVQGGHEATRVLRERFDEKALPIIALTAAALTSERDEALAAGMNDFLTKPIDAQRLHEALRRWGPRPARA